jgi:glycosyltransferase involved in cell wall biosynthesis
MPIGVSDPIRLMIVSDAWHPQLNGVVRTLENVAFELRAMGHDVAFVTPDLFKTIPCPTYSEIRLALKPGRRVAALIDDFAPTAIHIATEGPLGMAARRYCRTHRFPFTTSFHTRFPDYVEARFGLPARWFYALLRRFHDAAARTLVATPNLRDEMAARGFKNLALWGRGVDIAMFRPRNKDFLDLPRPIFLCVGRVAVEKNLPAFLSLDLPGTKLVVGGGPGLGAMRRRFPEVVFAGPKEGDELARIYAAADVFVFPSRTDTFGNVILESLASGVPVAAFPVTGPRDVIGDAPVGALNEDLQAAALEALTIAPAACRAFACKQSWRASAEQFLAAVVLFNTPFVKRIRPRRVAPLSLKRSKTQVW